MELSNVFLKIFLSLIVDPLLEVVEIEDIRVGDLSCGEPFNEKGEIVSDFFSVEDSVNHVTAEES